MPASRYIAHTALRLQYTQAYSYSILYVQMRATGWAPKAESNLVASIHTEQTGQKKGNEHLDSLEIIALEYDVWSKPVVPCVNHQLCSG